MSNPTQGATMNAPVWNNLTTVQTLALTGGFDTVTVTGYYAIFSNVGANNLWVGPDNVNPGIQVAPGETFETAILADSPLFVFGTAGQIFSVIEYKS